MRRLAYGAADAGLLSPELAAGIRRVKGAKKLGVRLGNWLTAAEARRFWQAPDASTLKGKRDRATLATLLGCGFERPGLRAEMFRYVCRAGKCWGEGVTERIVWHVVKRYAAQTGLAGLAPHELRRYAESRIMPNRQRCSHARLGLDLRDSE